jgi:ABC-type Fe3+-siderophore transport system permease subunit
MSEHKPRSRFAEWLLLFGLFGLLFILSLAWGSTGRLGLPEAARGLLSILGLVEADLQVERLVSLRLWKALTTAGVGSAMALSGALLQGVFRNALAAPSIIGVTGGASLGAAAAVLVFGGYAPSVLDGSSRIDAQFAVALASFLGALLVSALIVSLSTRAGRISVTTLLLAGIAVNACCSGVLALVQTITLSDYEIARNIFAWSFGNLNDRSQQHALTIILAVLASLVVIPFLRHELDLFRGGEDDARALGVRTEVTKWLAIGTAALLAAVAVSVAGQIVFVGLVVPHLTRLLLGSSNRQLLPFVVLTGAVFLLGAEWGQTALLGDATLRPGVLMSLIGGPFFLVLLLRRGTEIGS